MADAKETSSAAPAAAAPGVEHVDTGGLGSIEATVDLPADPDAQHRLRAAEADVGAGEVLDERVVRELVARRHHP